MREILFKLARSLQIHRLFKSGRATVICLHRINPNKDPLFVPLSPALFAELVRGLKKEYEITSFKELRERKKWGKPPLVISFDDGYKDFLEHAIPVIRKEQITVNHNIVTSCADTGQLIWTQRFNNLLTWLFRTEQELKIEQDDFQFHSNPGEKVLSVKNRLFKKLFPRPYIFNEKLINNLERKYSFMQPSNEMMNWNDILTCEKEGTEIGSHTMFHGSLGEDRGRPVFEQEIIGSKKALEGKLGHLVDSIAFPNGWAHEVAYRMAINAGYKNMLMIDGVSYSFDLNADPSVRAYKRILVGHSSVAENIFSIAGFHKALKLG